MSQQQPNLNDIALTLVIRHAAEHLDGADLVKRITTKLMEDHAISEHTAFQIASQAWAEYDGRNVSDFIDLMRSTGRCIVVCLEDGRTVALTTRHLVRAVELLTAAGETLPGHCPEI